ncbi:MAG: YceI family protein [Bacteroidota bacterium]
MSTFKWISILALGILLLAARTNPNTELPQPLTLEGEKLIVFSQERDEHFRNTSLPKIRDWASAEGLELVELNAADGTPADITATPAIVFQNQQGRALYASRYAELGTIKNFVRTNRLRPQMTVPFCAEQVLQYRSGRGALNAPVKLTTLQGSMPDIWPNDEFQVNALAAIQLGMGEFSPQAEACLERTDRAFYCDFHPYRSADGMLYLSLELYSMFNCIRPVFTTGDQPLRGAFNEYPVLFAQAGKRLQEEILRLTQSSTIGDAWSPLAETVANKSWEDLGLALPPEAANTAPPRTDFTVAQQWAGAKAVVPGVPPLFFRFMEPLDRYAGEVPDFAGELNTDASGNLRSGNFTARLRSLTMGMAELDDKVKKKYIYARKFPEANFRFDLPETAQSLLQAGRLNRIAVPGTFTFMKQEQPMTVQAELTPQLLDSGEQQLLVHVQFDLNITDDYGIAGPDGPDPARKTMVFDLNFIMLPQ